MNDTKKFNLPPLPFGENDLSPIISSDTIQLHYGKHHQAYFNMLNTLAEGTKYNDMTLEDVVVESFKDKEQKIFNNAGQAWNHILYWDQMKPGGETAPSGRLHTMIENSFEDPIPNSSKFVFATIKPPDSSILEITVASYKDLWFFKIFDEQVVRKPFTFILSFIENNFPNKGPGFSESLNESMLLRALLARF